MDALSFRIAGRNFALPLLQTREVVVLPPLAQVPATPPHILGVFNLVGRVVPVIDAARKLGLGQTAYGERSYAVVVDAPLGDEHVVVGIVVDELGGVIDDDGSVERLDLHALMEGR